MTDERWLDAFHRGDRDIIDACYREHFRTVDRAVARRLTSSDRDSVVQEVFMKLLAHESFRRSFQGGDLGAFLAQAATFQAISFARQQGRTTAIEGEIEFGGDLENRIAARQFLERFRARVPEKWLEVFNACFLEQMDQRSAAKKLGIARTTLAYQVLRIRWLLDRFVVEGDR